MDFMFNPWAMASVGKTLYLSTSINLLEDTDMNFIVKKKLDSKQTLIFLMYNSYLSPDLAPFNVLSLDFLLGFLQS
jgi:hypothetical protein